MLFALLETEEIAQESGDRKTGVDRRRRPGESDPAVFREYMPSIKMRMRLSLRLRLNGLRDKMIQSQYAFYARPQEPQAD